MKINIPYGRQTKTVELPDEQVKAVLTATHESGTDSRTEEQIVLDAMESPIDSPTLRELAAGRNDF